MTTYLAGNRARSLTDAPILPGPDHWWVSPYGRWRLAAEIEAMRRFPGFSLDERDHRLRWDGWVRSALPNGRRYRLVVPYPLGFPDVAPEVRIVEPTLQGAIPHLLEGDRPCLYQSYWGVRHGYDPARTTAATLVAWTALWLHAFETWRATGQWPGRED